MLELRVQAGGLVIDTIPRPAAAEHRSAAGGRRGTAGSGRGGAEGATGIRVLVHDIRALQAKIAELVEPAGFRSVEARTTELLEELARPSFWDDQERARRMNSATYQLSRITQQLADLRRIDALAEVPAILTRHRRTSDMAELDRLQWRLRGLETGLD